MTRRPIFLIVNPVAGGKIGSGPRLATDIDHLTPAALAAALRAGGLAVRAHELDGDDDAGALAREAAAAGHDVVVAGGDGTVGLVAARLVGSDATLGILAMGSFNNVARGLEVPRRLEEALRVIVEGRSVAVDVGQAAAGRAVPQLFFEAAGVGMDALLFAAATAGNRHGLRVGLVRMWHALRWSRHRVRIAIDGGPPVLTRILFLTASNAPYYGFGFTVGPGADPTDGQLEISVFTKMSKWAVITHFLAVTRGRFRHEPRIRRLSGRRVVVEGMRRTLPAHVDGRVLGRTPVTFEALPGALRVFRDPELAHQAARELGED